MPFKTFTAEALREFEHHFPGSGFVRKNAVGVGSVSGPAAVVAVTIIRRNPARTGRHYYFGEFHTDVKRVIGIGPLTVNDDHGSD